MKICFMGSPDFAVPSLKKLIASGHEITSCFTRAPAPKNRGKKIVATPIEILAKEYDIPVFTPKTLRDMSVVEIIKKQEIDFLIVVAYGMILPEDILNIPKYEALNLHPSALPRFRGAAPLQRTLMAGDSETEICIMKMSKGLDEGDIYLKEKLQIPENMNLLELHDKSANIGADLMLKTIDNFADLTPIKQSEEGVVYADKITKEEARLDFNKNGRELINLIRGINAFPGAYFIYKEDRIKIFSAEFIKKSHNEDLGTVSKNFEIFCKDGIIIPKILQRSGKRKMNIEEFINALCHPGI